MTDSPDELATALMHHKAGRHRQAEEICRRILAGDPTHAGSWQLLGVLELERRHYDAAVEHLSRAIEADPNDAAAHANLGLAQQGLARLDEAAACYRRALAIQPHYAATHNNLGNILKLQGKWDEAVACYRRAIEIRAGYVDPYYNLGMTLRVQGRPEEAIACYQQALALKPDHAGVLNSLGNVFKEQGRLEEAASSYHRALQADPNYHQAHYNLGLTLRAQNRPEEAVASYRRALQIKPDYAQAHNNLGNTLRVLGQLDEAAESCRQAIALRPDYAQAHRNLAIALLLQGDLAAGWPEYEWRLRCNDAAVSAQCQPLWDGSPLDGRTIMLFSEQGMGDVLQFIRYAAVLRRLGGTVLLDCPVPLVGLLQTCPDIEQLIPRGQPLPHFDVACPLLSLPAVLQTTLDTIPADVPYLHADQALVERWVQELGSSGFQVGIAWQGNRDYPEDQWRSIPLAQFQPLAEIAGVKLISLQKGPGAEQVRSVDFPVTDISDRLDEEAGPFMDTAAIMKHVDLVVTCDTAIGHLAGALGVATWLAVPAVPDWRWLLQGEGSVWYPSLRLFRQKERGDWSSVFGEMAQALAQTVSEEALPAVQNVGEAHHLSTAENVTGSETVGPIRVEIAPGELIDKITILEIKAERITDPQKRHHVSVELAGLTQALHEAISLSARLDELAGQLKAVNEALWDVEDALRHCEQEQDFGLRFVELARSVYAHNDRRSELKRQINRLLGSRLVEEKSYSSGGTPVPTAKAPRQGDTTPTGDATGPEKPGSTGEPWLDSRHVRLKACRHGPMLYLANDRYIGRSLDRYGEFSEGELELFRQLVRPDQVVLDIGANIGTHTVAFAQMVEPAGVVYAFEPQRVLYQMLCGNVALNALTNVHAWQAAVGRRAGSVSVPVLDYGASGNFGAVSLRAQAAGESVSLLAIDQLDFTACHLIKIDVEGMEADVLAGAEQTLRRHRPMLYLENDRQDKSAALIEQLFGLDYRLYWHLPPLFNPRNYFNEPENLFPGVISANMLGIHHSVTQNVALREIHTPDEDWSRVSR